MEPSSNSEAAQQEPDTRTGSFEPKYQVHIEPPKNDEYTLQELALRDGTNEKKETWVAIKGVIFDVSGKEVYGPGGSYHAFAGKDASRALAQSSLRAEDVKAEWEDLSDEHKKVLEEWYTYFSKRYSIKGKVVESKV